LVVFLSAAIRLPRRATLFPYTTLFRSGQRDGGNIAAAVEGAGGADRPGKAAVVVLRRISSECLRRVFQNGVRVNHALFQRQRVQDRKSTRLNSSHVKISYAVFCLKKKK